MSERLRRRRYSIGVGKRGVHKTSAMSMRNWRLLVLTLHFANLLTDFYDQLKSITSGYGSFNYELHEYKAEDLVRLDFYIAGERVDALSIMVHRSEAEKLGPGDG